MNKNLIQFHKPYICGLQIDFIQMYVHVNLIAGVLTAYALDIIVSSFLLTIREHNSILIF